MFKVIDNVVQVGVWGGLVWFSTIINLVSMSWEVDVLEGVLRDSIASLICAIAVAMIVLSLLISVFMDSNSVA